VKPISLEICAIALQCGADQLEDGCGGARCAGLAFLIHPLSCVVEGFAGHVQIQHFFSHRRIRDLTVLLADVFSGYLHEGLGRIRHSGATGQTANPGALELE
jgi:hypothetical protein